jgi:hypothetical protein
VCFDFGITLNRLCGQLQVILHTRAATTDNANAQPWSSTIGQPLDMGSSLLGDCEHVYLCIRVRYKHAVTTNIDRNFI